MPRGGARPGAGRKKASEAAQWLGGDAGKRGEAPKERPKAEAVRLIPAPAGLTPAEAQVWNDLAPYACGQRTLVDGTMAAFGILCRQVVIERELALSREARGSSNHRGMMQRVEAGMLKFRLSPIGKPLETPEEAPVDPFAEFDAAGNGVQ